MKKLIAVLTLLFAFTVSANAQDKKAAQNESLQAESKVSSEKAAKQDVQVLSEKVTVGENLKKDLTTLMVMKHDILNDSKKTPSEKASQIKGIQHKVLAAFSEEDRKKIESDAELMKRLSN